MFEWDDELFNFLGATIFLEVYATWFDNGMLFKIAVDSEYFIV